MVRKAGASTSMSFVGARDDEGDKLLAGSVLKKVRQQRLGKRTPISSKAKVGPHVMKDWYRDRARGPI
jgi:hypothetical protein